MNAQSVYAPVLARTQAIRRPIGPVAYDCVKIIVVRSGSAVLFSEFGCIPVNVGDVVVLGANVLWAAAPEGQITVTTIFLDTDYVLDQVFWQHAELLHDRLDTREFAETVYSEPAQVLHLGDARTGLLMPWLDELVMLSAHGQYRDRFYRMQSLFFAIADVISPFVRVSSIRLTSTQRSRTRPTLPRDRPFAPMREEARQVREALHRDAARAWTLADLAGMVHLSTKQLTRVFVDAYGKTPHAYLTMVRVEQMARLLHQMDLTIAEAGRRVGWRSRNRATIAFRDCVGLTPSQYRELSRRESSAQDLDIPARRKDVIGRWRGHDRSDIDSPVDTSGAAQPP